jgi:hypothetical protein
MLAEFPLVEAVIGPIDVDLYQRWMYGVQIPRPAHGARDIFARGLVLGGLGLARRNLRS